MPLENLNDLVKAFTEYTESIITTSNLTTRRNLVKEKADKRQSLRHRWEKHYRSFASLAEDQSRGKEKTASSLELSDSKIKENEADQEKTVRRLLSSIFANTMGSNPRLLEDSNVNREISTIKADLRDMKSALNDPKQNFKKKLKHGTIPDDMEQKMRDLATNSMTKSAMTEYESKLAQLTVNLSILQNSFSQHETAIAQLPHIQDLIDKLNSLLLEFGQTKEKSDDLSTRIDEQNIRLQILSDQQNNQIQVRSDEEEKRYRGFNEALNAQKENIQLLTNEVTGNPDKEVKGLIEFITEGVERDNKLQNAVRSLDGEFGNFTLKTEKLENEISELKSHLELPKISNLAEDLVGIKERLGKLELSMPPFQAQQPAPDADAVSAGKELTDSNKKVEEKVTNVEDKLAAIEQQQEEKDEMVAGEVERLDLSLKAREDEVKHLKAEISALQSQISILATNQQPQPPPLAQTLHKVEETLLQKMKALEHNLKQFKDPLSNRTDAIEVIVESLQQRFDNLSTEPLATAIIHQMQKLYPPHPGNVRDELNNLKNRDNMIDSAIHSVWQEFRKVNSRVEQQAQHMAEVKKEILDNVERKLQDFAIKNGSSAQDMQAVERRLTNLFLGKINEGELKFADFSRQSTDSHHNLYRTFEEIKQVVTDESIRLRNAVDDIAAVRAHHVSQKASIIEILETMEFKHTKGEQNIMKDLTAIHAKLKLLDKIDPSDAATATVAAGTEKQQQQQDPTSVLPTIETATADPKLAVEETEDSDAPLTASKSKAPTKKALRDNTTSDRSVKGTPATKEVKRARESTTGTGGNETDSSGDARPVKVRRRGRGSKNLSHASGSRTPGGGNVSKNLSHASGSKIPGGGNLSKD